MEPTTRDRLYTIVLAPFHVWAAFYCLLYRMQGLFLLKRTAFANQSQALARVPGFRGTMLRHAFYRMTLKRCGKRITISYGTILSDPETEIGDYVFIGAYCTLGLVSVGKHAMLGSNVDIPSGPNVHGSERPDVPMQYQKGHQQRIHIGEDTWLANGSLIMADVSDHAIVGGGAVVTKPVPEGAVVVGTPARILRYRKGFTNHGS